MDSNEIAQQLRGLVTLALVRSSDDGKEAQTVNVQLWTGHDPTDVEVLQPFGHASRAPDGGLMLVLAVGGDQSNLIGIPVGSPEHRLGNLDEGEGAIYGILGNRVICKADGSIEAVSPNRVVAKVKNNELELTENLVRGRLGSGDDAPRFAANGSMVKLRIGSDWIVVQDGSIVSSRPIIVGPDPDPSL